MAKSMAAGMPGTTVRTSLSSSENRSFRTFPLFSSPRSSALSELKTCALNLSSDDVASKDHAFSSLDELLENSDKPLLVDFYAAWCGPCQYMVPILDQLSTSMVDKICVVKIDTEKYPAIADEYKIEALPTFILFKDGKQCDRFEGAMVADKLIERIEASLQ